ncbi:MAG: phosphoglycerate mutase family protein [Promethearchaeota archaeon]
MSILESTPWGKKAQILLQSLAMLQPDLPTILILRHSAREEPPEMVNILNAPLTESGRQGAEEFGQLLPSTWSYTLHSSPVGRCQDTATHIQKGLEINQIEVQNNGIMDNLHYITVDPVPFMKIFSREGMQFLQKWIDGQFSTKIVEPAINVAQRAAKEIKSHIISQNSSNLNVYLTHDFQTILFLYFWGKIDAMTDWIPYLNGFFLQFSDSSLIFTLNGKKIEVSYPDWWPNL